MLANPNWVLLVAFENWLEVLSVLWILEANSISENFAEFWNSTENQNCSCPVSIKQQVWAEIWMISNWNLGKVLPGIFCTLNIVFNGMMFPVFGPTELKIWFFTCCRVKLEIFGLQKSEPSKNFQLSFQIDSQFQTWFYGWYKFSCDIKPSFLNHDFQWIKTLLRHCPKF